MPAYLQALVTRVPPCSYRQDYARDRMMSWVSDPRVRRLVRQIYDRSGIEKRHSVLTEFLPGAAPDLFQPGPEGTWTEPSTQERNRVYIREARRLSVEAARAALAECPGLEPSDITHVITVSCTGFYNPGPDYDVVVGLGLSSRVERYHLGFMGCYAAFPALRMAQQFCQANPAAVVLIVSVELCSLHLQVRPDLDSLLGNALFADGAGAAVVSARNPGWPCLVLRDFHSSLVLEGKAEMAWEIGNRGFNLVLSSYVPDLIAANIRSILNQMELEASSIEHWAVHPGGKAILDKLARALELKPESLGDSRAVLREYGNMSSATIFFVLRRFSERVLPEASGKVCALAFGPGLAIEAATLEIVNQSAKAGQAVSIGRAEALAGSRDYARASPVQ